MELAEAEALPVPPLLLQQDGGDGGEDEDGRLPAQRQAPPPCHAGQTRKERGWAMGAQTELSSCLLELGNIRCVEGRQMEGILSKRDRFPATAFVHGLCIVGDRWDEMRVRVSGTSDDPLEEDPLMGCVLVYQAQLHAPPLAAPPQDDEAPPKLTNHTRFLQTQPHTRALPVERNVPTLRMQGVSRALEGGEESFQLHRLPPDWAAFAAAFSHVIRNVHYHE